jgi:Tfp pilus assembly protein PilF
LSIRKVLISIVTIIIVGFVGCSPVSRASRSEFDFANKLAKDGLWKEALYRWEKTLKQGKSSAAVYNNMAVALEEMGRFEEAEKSYRKALSISPNNSTIQGNYDRLKKILKPKADNEKKEK